MNATEQNATAPPSLVSAASVAGCPPPGFASQQRFDLGDFVHRPWYVQQRMRGAGKTPSMSNLCIVVVYDMRPRRSFWGYDITLQVRSRDDRFPHAWSSRDDFCARIRDRYTGKFTVAKCSTPSVFAGKYWVVAHDEQEGFAIVSGGPPTRPSSGVGCATGMGNDSGLWLMTREQRRDEFLLEKARSRAMDLGFSLSVLEDIYQGECSDINFDGDFHV